jgi:hypothetical protein
VTLLILRVIDRPFTGGEPRELKNLAGYKPTFVSVIVLDDVAHFAEFQLNVFSGDALLQMHAVKKHDAIEGNSDWMKHEIAPF